MTRRARRHAELVSASISKQTLKRVQGDRRCKCRVAFTLAEVLITLTIIGVIAALTIPNLIAKHEKEETVTKLKKVYSTLSQAVGTSIAENGPIDSWETPEYGAGSNSSKTNYVVKYVYNYLRVAKKCYIYEGKNPYCSTVSKTAPNGASAYIWGVPQVPMVILEDGTQIYMGYHSFLNEWNTSLHLVFDINGDKKPNMFGKDVFVFTIDKNGLKPFNVGLSEKQTCKEGWPGNGLPIGLTCAALIMKDSWQIKDDYPW